MEGKEAFHCAGLASSREPIAQERGGGGTRLPIAHGQCIEVQTQRKGVLGGPDVPIGFHISKDIIINRSNIRHRRSGHHL